MISDIAAYLAYFDSVHRRTLRDIAALPPVAATWAPPRGEGEAAWSIGRLALHIGASRGYFAAAFRDEGWIYPEPDRDPADPSGWAAYLEETAAHFRARLADAPDDWLRRRVPLIDTDGRISGWRVLLMMIEHEVHHRSQIDTYAGIEGWTVPQIFDRAFEQIQAQRDTQIASHQR